MKRLQEVVGLDCDATLELLLVWSLPLALRRMLLLLSPQPKQRLMLLLLVLLGLWMLLPPLLLMLLRMPLLLWLLVGWVICGIGCWCVGLPAWLFACVNIASLEHLCGFLE